MPLYEKTPQEHEPGCWRWSSHWRCAVDLVDRLAAILVDIQATYATVTERGQVEVVITPALYRRIEEALAEAQAKPVLVTTPVEVPRFSFGKPRW